MIREEFDFLKDVVFTDADMKHFKNSKICCICKEKFKDGDDDKVRDHCHFTGKYRGVAHNKLRPQFQETKIRPVIFHNLCGYDSYLFMKNLDKTEGNIWNASQTLRKNT